MLRILSYNIRFGGVGRERPLAAAIRKAAPDLVVFQEATRPGVVARLAKDTGMTSWASTPTHSVAYMSRLDVARYAWHRPRASRRAFLEIVLTGPRLRVFGLHLSAVHSNWTERLRMRELKSMLADIEGRSDGPHVVVGDFNTLAPGETLDLDRLPFRLQILAWLGGRSIRWRTIQTMLDADYVAGFRLLHPGGEGHTFTSWDPHLRLDYVFVPAAAAERLRRCEVLNGVEAVAASDHFPVLAELVL